MNIEEFRIYCLQKNDVIESFPFDEQTLVFKVKGKMFALTDLMESFSINIKCDPDKAIELREHYSCVLPGYHMNKKHWNTVFFDTDVSDKLLLELVLNSYNLVFERLPKRLKETLK